MALGDQAGLKAIEELNSVTIPALTKAVELLVERIDRRLDEDIEVIFDQAHAILDRINGMSLQIPPRKN
jgi:hypothetical protein